MPGSTRRWCKTKTILHVMYQFLISIATVWIATSFFLISDDQNHNNNHNRPRFVSGRSGDGDAIATHSDMTNSSNSVGSTATSQPRTSAYNLACSLEVQNATEAVHSEIMKNIRLSPGVSLFGPFSDDLCSPVVERIACSALGNSMLPCKQPFLIEHFNYHFQHHCLTQIVDELYKRKSTAVPRLFHYIWYYNDTYPMRFYQYIGLLSILRYFQPEVIFVWNNGKLPSGQWWNELIGHLNQNTTGNITISEYYNDGERQSKLTRTAYVYQTRLISVLRDGPQFIYGNAVNKPEHKSDIIRMEATLLYGGLYADTDIIAIRSFDPLMNFPITMGRDAPKSVSNGVIFADRRANYLYLLHHSYTTFKSKEWSEHSTIGNQAIYKRCSELLHLESTSLIVPNYYENRDMFNASKTLNFTNAYSIHVWWRHMPFAPNPIVILMWTCAAATVLRNTYYGHDMEPWYLSVKSNRTRTTAELESVARCPLLVRNVTASVNREISLSLESRTLIQILGLLDSKCEPLTERITCEKLASSSPIPCKKDMIIERFNYHLQYRCLTNIANKLSSADSASASVPRIFHSTWYYGANTPLKFHQYLGILSVLKFFKPEVFFLWNEGALPTGKWWYELLGHLNQNGTGSITLQEQVNGDNKSFAVNRTVHFYNTRLIAVTRLPPSTIYGTRVTRPQHYSEIVRMEALLLYGGLYTDVDVIAIRSLDALLNFPITMGRDNPESISTAVILALPQSGHLYLLHNSYRSFRTGEWNEHSTVGNQAVYSRCPSLLHVENSSLIVPPADRSKDMFNTDQLMNLAAAYSIHVWWRHIPFEPDPLHVLTRNCTTSVVLRNMYYGTCTDFCGAK